MKRAVIVILVLVGAAGLIGLLGYHPRASTVGAAPSAASSSDSSVQGSATTAPSTAAGGSYKDGTYTGTAVDNAYGTVQVQAIVSGGKITQVKLLQMPNDREQSQQITSEAGPLLQQEAISAQSSNIDTVSGATQDSDSFAESLQTALSQAKV